MQEDLALQIQINANMIWPILLGQFSESEKTGYRFMLSAAVLHELAVSGHLARMRSSPLLSILLLTPIVYSTHAMVRYL